MTHYMPTDGAFATPMWIALAIMVAAIAWLIYTKRKGKRRK